VLSGTEGEVQVGAMICADREFPEPMALVEGVTDDPGAMANVTAGGIWVHCRPRGYEMSYRKFGTSDQTDSDSAMVFFLVRMKRNA
jgi:hypothetical protein